MTEFLWWPGWIAVILVSCATGVVIAAAFVVRYQVQTGGAWHLTPEGRWTMYRRVMEVSILGLTLVNYFFPMWPGVLPVSAAVMTAFALQTYVPHRLLTRAQRASRDRTMERIVHDRDTRDANCS